MKDDNLVLVDQNKSIPWNYVNRINKELSLNNSHESVLINSLIPNSYKDVVRIISKACNYSCIALLLDNYEEYVAFMLVVDENYIPFMLDELDDIITPMKAVYKVFPNTKVATSHDEDNILMDFISDTVIPDLDDNFDTWTHFVYDNDL